MNQNFTDIINGTSDGTKDLSINALTVAGTATLNGNINLGNASGDDLSITASLASSIPIKTANSYDIGSATLPLRSVYIASSDSAAKSVRILGGVVGTSYTLTLPTSGGTSGYFMTTDGAGATSWASVGGPEQASNYGLTASVSANALTVALKGADGNDPSSTNKVSIAFRNATATTGTPSIVQASSATSVVVSSGSTLGHASAVPEYVHVYALNNAGTIELAVTSTRIDEGSVLTTTAEGGAGAADSKTTIYSTNARVGVAVRYLGRLKSTQATAGTWATAISEISLKPTNNDVQEISVCNSDSGNGSGAVNTKIRRFTNNTTTGSAITYADSANAGASYTINEYGLYSGTYMDTASGGSFSIGFSLNSAELTTGIATIITATNIGNVDGAAALFAHATFVRRLNPGDVVRPHWGGTAVDSTAGRNKFIITKIAD